MPTSLSPKAFVTGAAKFGAVAVPVFWKYSVSPSRFPTRTSMSPSPSMSAKAGARVVPASESLSPNALAIGAAKAGAVVVPVFWKYSVLPARFPTKASR